MPCQLVNNGAVPVTIANNIVVIVVLGVVFGS